MVLPGQRPAPSLPRAVPGTLVLELGQPFPAGACVGARRDKRNPAQCVINRSTGHATALASRELDPPCAGRSRRCHKAVLVCHTLRWLQFGHMLGAEATSLKRQFASSCAQGQVPASRDCPIAGLCFSQASPKGISKDPCGNSSLRASHFGTNQSFSSATRDCSQSCVPAASQPVPRQCPCLGKGRKGKGRGSLSIWLEFPVTKPFPSFGKRVPCFGLHWSWQPSNTPVSHQ